MTTAAPPLARPLRRLYLVRFGFAVVWALLLALTGSDLNPVSVGLLVLYPVFDVAAAVVDLRSSRTTTLVVNVVISALAAIGLAVAAASGVPAVLRVWGAWAIVSGLVQLVVGVGRRALGGQLPMMLAGGISVLAGASFVAMAGADDPAVTGVAGYAAVGGVFFLVSALRLGRAAREA
ncbi:hypothetical protein [Cryptosporangium japonicum]|uniref:Membrane protein n=1 Tax=Cryptosporangium japonicum TaxID=80872 RepID=A0ABP3ER47_9ACTN